MKKTALSKRDLETLERIIAGHGNIVTSRELAALFPEYSYAELNQRVKLLVERRWLVRIKRGLYAVSTLESHGFANVSPLVVSQVLVPGSYVSFEFALNHHGLFDQLPGIIAAVTPLKSKTYRFQDLEYRFVKARSEMMTGFTQLAVEGQEAAVAEAEKALVDFLHFRKDRYTIDLVLEKLKEARRDLDPGRLAEYSKAYPVTVQRRLGFLLDVAGIESERIHRRMKKTAGFARLTTKSDLFNALWRIYYEDRFAH